MVSWFRLGVKKRREEGGKRRLAYQIGERVELLPHHAALFPPARDLAVEEVEEEAEGEEEEGRVEVAVFCRVAETVAHRGEEGEDAAEAWRVWSLSAGCFFSFPSSLIDVSGRGGGLLTVQLSNKIC